MILKRLFVLFLSASLIGCICFEASAQKVKHSSTQYSTENKKAIKKYDLAVVAIDVKRDFDGGLGLLNDAIALDPSFIEAHMKIAGVYEVLKATNHDYFEFMLKHYLKIDEIAPNSGKYVSVYSRLAEIYAGEGDYELAKEYALKVKEFPRANEKILKKNLLLLDKIEFAHAAKNTPLDFKAVEMPRDNINRWDHNSHPSLTADQNTMILSVRRNKGFVDENIVIAHRNEETKEWMPTSSISELINTPNNEGMASISGDGKTLVFASSNQKGGFGGVDLYISVNEGGKWSKPVNLGKMVNSRYRESEPSLSADGRTIYFTSDRPGGQGRYDIWVTHKNEEGVWMKPDNMGHTINTSEDEVTPFIHANGRHLYFASRGHIGMGGYDLFMSERMDGFWNDPMNLGYPLNTEENEGSMFITADYKKGYYEKYITGKDPRMSHSHIMEFDVPSEIQQKMKCVFAKGVVYDASTKKQLAADIQLVDLKTSLMDQFVRSDAVNGDYTLVLTEGGEYALHVQKEGYLFKSMNFDYTTEADFDPFTLDVYLEPIQSATTTTLRNIFFETGSYSLKRKSKYELDKLIYFMLDNPEVKIEVSGHTDNVGNVSSNQKLSENRAKSVYDYLISHEVDTERVRFKGYGQTKPIASNANSDGRKQNRRIDIRIL